MSRTSTRAAALLVALAMVLVGVALPASAAGTGDVELVPAARDGVPQTSFRVSPGDDSLSFDLVNLSDEPRSARLYAASVDVSEGGGMGAGAAGSAPWLELPDAEVPLAGGERRTMTVPLDLRALPENEEQLGAIILEAPQGAITIRVATLVTVEPRPALPLPLWAVALAAISMLVVVFGLVVARRRRRAEPEPAPEVQELVGV